MLKDELHKYTSPEKAAHLPRFFKTGPGEYGEGDVFIGVTVPDQRKVARNFFKQLGLAEIQELLGEKIHEYRLTALFILTYKYEKAKDETEQKAIVNLYLANTAHINNWDLVDSSADKILGAYLFDKDKQLLYAFARSGDLWQQRMAIIATYYFIKKGEYQDTLKIAENFLAHKHDLIHKAVGWMLREVGNRNPEVELDFLKQHYHQMPRTMLRYAIEKFEEGLRQKFLKGLV